MLYLTMKEIGLHHKITDILKNLNKNSQMSPKGFLIYLIFICDCAYARKYGSSFYNNILSNSNLKIFAQLFSESQYKAIREWPKSIGGGSLGAELLWSQIIRILVLPFNPSVNFK